ncbi:MAG TPA: hypothetical protein VM681_04800 [Candidatus Thermoplasmatota archaeon]|nr:hypothetical protein [Candidatus Thermoplasmatota archaeon]
MSRKAHDESPPAEDAELSVDAAPETIPVNAPIDPASLPPAPATPPAERAVINHLLFHKALISEESGNQRVNEYIEMVKASNEGEHLVIPHPFDRAIAIAFQLVIREHLNPWDIDLLAFSKLYLERVREKKDMDLITAGRLIFLAWSVLKLQSDAAVSKAETVKQAQEEQAENAWDAIPDGDWLTDDADYAYTTTVLGTKHAPIDEKIRHKGDRKVTLIELVEAFEEAKREAETRQVLVAEREKEKERWKLYSRQDVKEKVHKEDLEKEIALVWERINRQNGGPIRFDSLHLNTRDDLVRSFISVLFLAAGKRIRLWQENFPYGPIFLKNLERAKGDGHATEPMRAESPIAPGTVLLHEGPLPTQGIKLRNSGARKRAARPSPAAAAPATEAPPPEPAEPAMALEAMPAPSQTAMAAVPDAGPARSDRRSRRTNVPRVPPSDEDAPASSPSHGDPP